jgi:predicted MFS family arabinose efflux permease
VFDFNAFRNRPFNIFALASFAGFLGLYVPFFYIQQYSSSFAGVNDDLAFYTLVILNAGSVFGRIAPALIADRVGLLNTCTASTIGAAVLAFAWIACRSIGGIIAFALFYGFFAGFAAALQPAVLTALCAEANMIGTWVGMGSLFSSAGILIGNPIGGQLFHGHGGQNWLGVQLWCAVTVFACMLATGGTRIARADFGPSMNMNMTCDGRDDESGVRTQRWHGSGFGVFAANVLYFHPKLTK